MLVNLFPSVPANGELFTIEITNPIVYKINCWLANSCAKVSRVKKITTGNQNTRTIDFGNGECNCTKTVMVNGVSYQVNF